MSPQGYYVPAGTSPFASFRKNANGTGVIEGIKIFRSGTFKDSMGYQRTWEVEHLEQMIFHFGMLRDRDIFPNVPVRDGHPGIFGSGGEVIGYLANLTREDEFLLSDLEITEPDAFAKWERGTFRARSLEVGMYESNDESAYWPVVMGLAFVDIPAVEGLYSRYSNPARRPERSKFHFSQTVVDTDKEMTVAGEQTTTQPGTEAPQTPAAPAAPSNPQQAPADGGTATPPAAPAVPEAVPSAQHGNGTSNSTTTSSFRVNGQTVADYAAVQAHIDTLETFRRDTMQTARREFVSGLARDNKIGAPQIESLTAHALGLSDAQWDAFRVAYDVAPQVPLFGQHANGGGGTPSPSATDAVADEIDILEQRLAMHKRAGMTQDNIEKLDSFKRLATLKANRGVAAS